MHFSTLFAGAVATASVASALPLARRTGEHGNPPAGVTPGQWEDIWTKCGDQVQHGLINVGIDACVVAEVEALIGTVIDLTHLDKRTGEHGTPPAGVTPGQWQDIWVKCESQEQHGLINVGVDACVVAAVEALIGTVIDLSHLDKRTGEHGDPPAGVTPGQWQDIWVKCESQEQHGLINIGVDACVVAAVEALVGTVIDLSHLDKRTGEHGAPPAGCTPAQWEQIWTDCGKQEQEGLINIGIDACVVAAVEALLGTTIDLTNLDKRTGEHGAPPAGVTPGQWENIWTDCGKQEQEGLINIGVDACVVAAVEALVGTVIDLTNLDKRTGEHGAPPAGVTPGQWEKIWLDCGKQEQEGLINVGLDLCVAAAVEALLATIVHS